MIYNSIGLIFIISAFILLIYSYLVMPRCYLKPKKYNTKNYNTLVCKVKMNMDYNSIRSISFIASEIRPSTSNLFSAAITLRKSGLIAGNLGRNTVQQSS